MSSIELGAIAVALGLDAFGVALSLGFDKRIHKQNAVFFILSFGFFQFFLVFIGGFFGGLFNRYIMALPHIVGGTIIILVGILMIREGLSEQDHMKKIHWGVIILLGICVSIDALVVGFTTFDIFIYFHLLFENSVVVGVVTGFLTLIAFAISRYVRRVQFIRKYADFIGGFILILFGLKMIFW